MNCSFFRIVVHVLSAVWSLPMQNGTRTLPHVIDATHTDREDLPALSVERFINQPSQRTWLSVKRVANLFITPVIGMLRKQVTILYNPIVDYWALCPRCALTCLHTVSYLSPLIFSLRTETDLVILTKIVPYQNMDDLLTASTVIFVLLC